MTTTSANFSSSHEILYKTNIIHGEGWEVKKGEYVGKEAEIIDRDKSGKAETKGMQSEPCSPWYDFWYKEPALDHSMEDLRDFARAKGVEVITQDLAEKENLNLQAGIYQVNINTQHHIVTSEAIYSKVALSELVKNMQPYDTGAKWAIDMKSGEFMIYKGEDQKPVEQHPGFFQSTWNAVHSFFNNVFGK